MQWPSLRLIAEDTGIHRNRLFRIAQGADMKVSEYRVFQAKNDRIKNHLNRQERSFKDEFKDLVTLYIDQPIKGEDPSTYLKVRKSWMHKKFW